MSEKSYTHAEHGKMEYVSKSTRKRDIEGFRCTKCHVIAPRGKEDETFDSHDCEQYESVKEAISSNL